MNIIDYVKWRGDLPFDYKEFNEVDAVILCQCAYWPFEDYACCDLQSPEGIKLGQAASLNLFEAMPTACDEKDIELSKLLAESERFSDITLFELIKETDAERGIQFCAVTYKIGEDDYFIAFRGTDGSLVGWKENMDLAYNEKVPSQEEAVKYIEKIAAKTKGMLRIGGHSKGGNLAVFGAAFSSDDINDRIKTVYNFDGPGFNDTVIRNTSFIKIKNTVQTYVPETSIVGLLLEHREAYNVIHSTETNGFKAHRLTTWCVEKSMIERESELTHKTEIYHENISEWIDNMTYEEKKQFIEVLYGLVNDYETTDNLFTKKNILKVIMEYRKLEDDKKQAVTGAMSSLKNTVVDNIKEHFHIDDADLSSLKALAEKIKPTKQ